MRIGFPTRDDFEAWREASVLVKEEPADLAKEGGKPWLADAAGSQPFEGTVLGWALRGRIPGPRGEIVGYSGLEAGEDAARSGAVRSAAGQVKVLLVRDVADFVREEIPPRHVQKALDRFDFDVVRFVNDSTLDVFEQAIGLSGTPEPVHRAAILVKVDPGSFRPLLERFKGTIVGTLESERIQRRQIIVTVASALGLALVVFLLYAFVNAGTKGHFAWPLRIISFGTLLALYLALMYFQGWFPQ